MIFRICWFTLAAMLLGAHFLRAENFVMLALCVSTPLLLLVKRWWMLVLLQFLAYDAALVWIAEAVHLVVLRQHLGQPWILAAVILGGAALFSILAGVLLNSRSIRERYPDVRV